MVGLTCFLVSLVFGGAWTQHPPDHCPTWNPQYHCPAASLQNPPMCANVTWAWNPQTLQSICHDNYQQLTEDHVIHCVVTDIDYDGNGVIEAWELYVFFADLSGQASPEMIRVLENLDDEQVVAFATTVGAETHVIGKDVLTDAWHVRYNDNVTFIEFAFDHVFDEDGDGRMNATEMHDILLHAQQHCDGNRDGEIQNCELEAFLESVYKRPGCVDHPNLIGRR